MLQKVFLGETDYLGEKAKAYREVYPDRWHFVIETPTKRFLLMTY